MSFEVSDYLNPYWINEIHAKRRPPILRHRAACMGRRVLLHQVARPENIQLLNRDYRHAPVAAFN
jgi:hypothetical protein